MAWQVLITVSSTHSFHWRHARAATWPFPTLLALFFPLDRKHWPFCVLCPVKLPQFTVLGWRRSPFSACASPHNGRPSLSRAPTQEIFCVVPEAVPLLKYSGHCPTFVPGPTQFGGASAAFCLSPPLLDGRATQNNSIHSFGCPPKAAICRTEGRRERGGVVTLGEGDKGEWRRTGQGGHDCEE